MVNFIDTKEEFESIIQKEVPTIVIYVKEYCPICKRHVDDMMNKYKLSFHIFDVDKHKELYKKYKMSMLFPETRIYKKGEILFCIGGQLYESQIVTLRNKLRGEI
jgi:glutaredoxin